MFGLLGKPVDQAAGGFTMSTLQYQLMHAACHMKIVLACLIRAAPPVKRPGEAKQACDEYNDVAVQSKLF